MGGSKEGRGGRGKRGKRGEGRGEGRGQGECWAAYTLTAPKGGGEEPPPPPHPAIRDPHMDPVAAVAASRSGCPPWTGQYHARSVTSFGARPHCPAPLPLPAARLCCGASAGPRARRISRGAALLRAHQPPRAGSVARPQLRLGASAGPRAQVHQLGRGPGEGVAARAWGTAPAPTPDTSGRHSSAPTTTTLPSPTECPLNRSTPYASYPPTGILTIGIPCAPSPPPRPAASLQCRRSGPSSPPRVGGTQLKTPMGWAGSMGK